MAWGTAGSFATVLEEASIAAAPVEVVVAAAVLVAVASLASFAQAARPKDSEATAARPIVWVVVARAVAVCSPRRMNSAVLCGGGRRPG